LVTFLSVKELLVIDNIAKADGACGGESIPPDCPQNPVGTLCRMPCEEVQVKIPEFLIEVEHEVRCQELIVYTALAQAALLILLQYCTSGCDVRICTAVICVKPNTVQNIKQSVTSIEALMPPVKPVDLVCQLILIDDPVRILHIIGQFWRPWNILFFVPSSFRYFEISSLRDHRKSCHVPLPPHCTNLQLSVF
jgi:hypothetical protein